LWFDNQAEEAAEFYVAVFPGSRVVSTTRYPEGSAQPAGTVLTVEFELEGQRFVALNGGPRFTFDEAVSFQVTCADQEEIDRYWALLSDGGEEGPGGWLKDRFGLSWQVVPVGISRLLDGDDPARATRVMHAILGMNKIDIAALQVAAAGVAPARKATTTW
jgi:predicted 3-demethylubiquinone-9 3-methyltransferase (glyoxalase superfamily)